MKHQFAIADAKARLSELLRLAEDGDSVVLTRYGRPAAAIVRAEQADRLASESLGGFPDGSADGGTAPTLVSGGQASEGRVSKGQIAKDPAPAPKPVRPAEPADQAPAAAAGTLGPGGPVDRAKAMVLRRIEVDRQRLPKTLQPVMVLMRDNVFKPGLTVHRIKAVLEVGSNSFTTRFCQVIGTPIRRYLEDRRLECACRLLVETQLEIGEVGRLVGYRKVKSFSAAFRRRIGVRPGSYRGFGGTLSSQGVAGAGLSTAGDVPSPLRVPRYLLGVATVAPSARCGSCEAGLPPEARRRVFEDLAPICDGCAERRAPELASLLRSPFQSEAL